MRFLTDENFNGEVLDELLRLMPDLDVIRVQDTEIFQAEDSVVLAWAADHGRILLTHDIKTLVGDANARIAAGLTMPGILAIRSMTSVGKAVKELHTLIGSAEASDFENYVFFVA